jgi:hypothetical protein
MIILFLLNTFYLLCGINATGTVQFWEPMMPYEFVSGDVSQFYEEHVSYVSQTIDELPSYWSMTYDPVTNFTTLVLKGNAKNCNPEL